MAVERTDSGGSVVAIVAIVILAALVVLFFMYGLPRLQGGEQGSDASIEVNLPEGDSGSGSTNPGY